MGSLSRNKGRRFEQELVRLFREAMPGADVKRGLQSRSGQEVADVECPVFWIESKRGRKPNVRAALKQAESSAPKGRIPVAVIRDDRSDPFVVLLLDDFLELISGWWENARR